jgi:hypothetical protein
LFSTRNRKRNTFRKIREPQRPTGHDHMQKYEELEFQKERETKGRKYI